MDAAAFHQQYETLLLAFLRQLPDPGLRTALRQQADGYFRACALGVWQAGGGITPAHADWYRGIALGQPPEGSPLYWALADLTANAPGLPPPPFWARLCAYDRRTGHATARRFLETLSAFLLLFAGADGRISPQEAGAIQTYLDSLFAQWQREGLAGDQTPPSVAQCIPTSPAPGSPAEPAPPAPQAQPAAQPQQAPAAEPQPTLEELLAELDALCGLETVKEEVRGLINLVKVRRLREEAGLPTPPLSLHMVFLGNPGTGKTTVARLIAKLYKAIGVLSQGQLVEVDRSGLVAGYVGQTALKTQEVLQSALGGVLFIDEAYALAPENSPADFGREAIEVLLKGMEDHRKDLVVIVAGYTGPMEQFIHSNPGLESRFNKYLTFADYTAPQLLEIFHSLCKKNGYTLSPQAQEKAAAGFQALFDRRDANFGNARQVRNTFEDALARQANRVAALAEPSKEDLMTLLPEDLAL